MHRNVTAIYRNHATADLVCRELKAIGISDDRIHEIHASGGQSDPGSRYGSDAGAASGSAAVMGGRSGVVPGAIPGSGTEYGMSDVSGGGWRDDQNAMDKLHDLHLPEEDVRTYQQSVRQGDHVVSVEVDEDQVPRVKEIMRRPEAEAQNLDTRDTEFRDETLIPRTGETRTGSPDWMAQRDTTQGSDPYLRDYRRDRRLGDRDS